MYLYSYSTIVTCLLVSEHVIKKPRKDQIIVNTTKYLEEKYKQLENQINSLKEENNRLQSLRKID